MADDTPSSPPQRLSRYRSQRKAQQQPQADEVPDVPQIPPEPETQVDDGIARSRSRYHRKNGVPGQARPETAPEHAQPEVVLRSKAQLPVSQTVRPSTSPHEQNRKAQQTSDGHGNRYGNEAAQLGAEDPSSDYVNRDGYGAENDRKHHYSAYDASRNVEPAYSKPTGELFPPPRPEPVRPATKPVQLDGPPTSDKIRATKSMSQLPKYEDDDAEGGGCFGFFKRKRGEASPNAPEKIPIARQPHTSIGLQDAPVSAVNAGDRNVLIECGKSRTLFPVTPTTTAVDLIKSAANCMSERINVRSAVLLEHFGTVGVQRPLRRYEHIRDVMNSWDSDRQNSLILIEPGTGRSELELSITGAPKQRPEEATWWLSYSQKVGKWEKRFITLKEDGHIIAQKDPNKPQQTDNVCHLNDFDIYMPTQEKLKKKVKPPKKHCYAIKSQQKTIMLESTQNFVHFFSTGDKATADDFYAAVQGWRSWYLVNVLGEGKKPKPQEAAAEKEFGGPVPKGHKPGESFDSHYQLGSFKPLMDIEQFDNKRPVTSRSANAPPPSSGGFAKSANQFDPMISPERRTSTRRKEQHPPLSLKNQAKHPHLAEDEPLGNFAARASLEGGRPADGEFADGGLLGRSYSRRQRDVAERENQRAQPFTTGPNLLNGGYDVSKEEDHNRRQSLDGAVRRKPSTRAHKVASNSDVQRTKSSKHHGTGDLGRSGSMRKAEIPKPLIDLTPQYREPPQHAKKGKGHHPDQVGPGGLVDSATSPEDPLGIPSSTDWRGRNAMNNSTQSAGLQHSTSQHGRTRRPTTSRSPDSHPEAGAFTGAGLLAHDEAQRGWGGGHKGRGVADMSAARNGQPLLDVRDDSKFTKGSLLNRVERTQPSGPVIDRDKEYY